MGDKVIEIVYSEEKNIDQPYKNMKQPRQNKNRLYRHDKPNKPTTEGPHSPQFNSQQGPPLSSLSGPDLAK